MGARHYGAHAGKAEAETEGRSKGGSSCSTTSFGAQHRMEPDTMLKFQIREEGRATANARERNRQ